MKTKDQNKFLYFLSLPFIGIYYVVGFIFNILDYEFIGFTFIFKPLIIFFKYVSLGCYYTTYGIFYPLIYIYNLIIDKIYDSRKTKINLTEIAPYEEVNLDTSERTSTEENTPEAKKKLSLSEMLKEKWDNLSINRERKRKIDEKNRKLILEIQKEKKRSETPVAFKYTAIDPKGKKETNIFIALSKMEVLTYLTNENFKVLSIETSKLINILYGPDSQFHTQMSTNDLVFWLTQLSTHIKSGITLTDSMRI